MSVVPVITDKFGKWISSSIYALTALFGVLTVLFPVPSIAGAIGVGFVWAYGAFAVIGGLGTLWSVIRPNYKIELFFIWLVAGSFMIYDVSLWSVYLDRLMHPVPDIPPAYGPGVVIIIVVLFFLWRIVYLIQRSRELLKDKKVG